MPHFPAERKVLDRQIIYRLEKIQATFNRNHAPIDGWESVETGTQKGPEPIPTDGWEPFAPGTQWGGYNITRWFRAKATVPESMAGEPVVLLANPGADALAYVNGVPAGGLDRNHSEILLLQKAEGGETFDIVLEAHTTPNMYDDSPMCQFGASQSIAVRNDQAWSFYWDIAVAHAAVKALPQNTQTSQQLQDLVDWGIKQVELNDVDDVEAYTENLQDAQEKFRQKLKKFEHSWGMGNITYVGHSHIDTAWLWQIRETKRKCSRTFSTVLSHMEQYPEFIFSQGQPQLYEYVKDNYPTIWKSIKQRVKEGRWEVTGGGWVEQDSNVSGAEALVRQYLYGNRFFRREFGKHTELVWLPDAFGFPVTMPQIWKKAQMKAFGTTKINWSQYNQHPYSMFRWRGLDGSEIFSYMPPGSYNANPHPASILSDWDSFKQKDMCDDLPVTFGHGDGGGGPTRQQIENVTRMKDLAGFPKCSIGTLEETVAKMMKNVDWDDLPVYNDELYLELHRACQTTQARTKRNNRKGELLFRDTEFLSGVAMLDGFAYPQDAIYDLWKPFLCNQFHDILPGSSIREVYADADEDYAHILGNLTKLRETALKANAAKVNTAGEGTPVVVTNTLGWDRDDVASAPLPNGKDDVSVLNPAGDPVPSQVVTNVDGSKELLFEAKSVPSMGHAVYRMVDGTVSKTKSTIKVARQRLENDFFVVHLTRNGAVRQIVDKRSNRNVVPKGSVANDLQLFEDRPHAHDAWDVDYNIDENRWSMDDVVSITVMERGPVRGVVRVVKKTDKSTLTQDITVWSTVPRVDFVTSVEWNEKYRLLKAAFPVDVLSRTATYEIQYGAIERPTHHSNERDRAKFEVPGHRWIDLSEGDYGVSLLNDCKYGFDTYQNTMRISLLRSAVRPDPKADEGHHDFTYSVYPHAGTWREAQTVHRAYELNAPLLARVETAHEGDLDAVQGLVCADNPRVVIDCIKKAEDSDDLIVRLYEAYGTRGEVKLTFGRTPVRVAECDLMEENEMSLSVDDSAVSFEVKPWEIRTFKVTM